MKKKYLLLILLSLFLTTSYGQDINSPKKDPVGKWKFEAPYAPEGYNSGYMTVGLKEDQYSVEMSFANIDYKFIGERVKVANDSLFFSMYVESEIVTISLKLENPSKMTGRAVYSEGIIPLALDRETESK